MSTECTISIYIGNKTSDLEKIDAIEILIDSMLLKMTEAIGGQSVLIDEYWMDDGQMKVKTSYRSISDIEQGISGLEKLKQRYINRYNGRSVVLRPAKNLN